MIVDSFEHKAIADFIKSIDQDFPTPISSKVDINEYVEKISRIGNFLIDIEDNQIRGIVIYYSNKVEEKYAYISVVGVSKEHRGKGIATSLVKVCIDRVSQMNFKTLGIHSDNKAAIEMYKRIGFFVIDNSVARNYLEFSLK